MEPRYLGQANVQFLYTAADFSLCESEIVTNHPLPFPRHQFNRW